MLRRQVITHLNGALPFDFGGRRGLREIVYRTQPSSSPVVGHEIRRPIAMFVEIVESFLFTLHRAAISFCFADVDSTFITIRRKVSVIWSPLRPLPSWSDLYHHLLASWLPPTVDNRVPLSFELLPHLDHLGIVRVRV